MSQQSELRIHQLCGKVVGLDESSPDFEPTLQELRAAIRDHLLGVKDEIANFASLLEAKT
jgi:hypothetical protein